MTVQPQYVCAKTVARLTGLSPSTLAKLRVYRPEESPPFVRIGRAVRYPLTGPDGIEAWVAKRMVNRGVIQ